MIRQYEVLKQLGSGHFGHVSLCWGETPARGLHPAKARLVAIKQLNNARDPESLRLLLLEFALLDQVKHRSVVRVFEYLEEESAVVMEYVHGATLREVLDGCAKKREQVFTEAAVEMGCEIADALYQANTTPADNGASLRLVHRDLKPENIMLTPTGEVKILDFGLARVENADFAREDRSRVRGTPVYMAPEQARAEDIDHRTDLFALGLILYELLMATPAYRVPLDAPDPLVSIYAAIENGSLAEPCKQIEVKLPGLGSIVTRLLQARPRNRYQTGHDLLVDLRRQLYKDRGAYLQEFCSFYFGSVSPLSDPPDPRAKSASQRAIMSNVPRKTIEERLKESLENQAEPVGKSPVPVRRAPRAPEQESMPPRSAPLEALQPRVTPKIVPRSASAAARPDDEEIMPPSVKKAPASPAKKASGARSADENGMLRTVPVNESADEREVQGDHSATAFFAIPAPKSERPKNAPPAQTPMMSAPSGAPRPFTPAQSLMAPAQAMMPAPSVMAGGGGIQGPVSGYGQTPFHSAGPQQAPAASAESRVQSWRVYAILVAVTGLAAAFLVTVLAIGMWKFSQVQDAPTETVAVVTPAPAPKKKANQDTAASRAVAPAPKAPTKPRSPGTAASAAPAAPKSDKGTVSVSFSTTPAPLQIEVRCSDGFAGRASIAGGGGSVANVPTSGDCKMYPKGGVTATAYPVKGGSKYTCTITGTTTSCR